MGRTNSRATAATFIYRGQLNVELSRISFLLSAMNEAFDEVDVIHLSPGIGSTEEEFERFARSFSNSRSCTRIEAARFSVLSSRKKVRAALAPDAQTIMGVGFSIGSFLPTSRCDYWCVNGIPEERLLTRDTLRDRIAVWSAWRAAKRLRPDNVVVVSEPMADLIANRIGGRSITVPNAVDRSIFRPDETVPPTYLTYQGGGSPWQGLEKLAVIWGELHKRNSALRFRVISHDERAHVLAKFIAPEAIEICSVDHEEVAGLLQEARLGFLVRARGIVNQVSWPMKLGEYLAAGAPVVVTNCGWDAQRVVERHSAGLVIEWDDPPEVSAAKIADFLNGLDGRRPDGVEDAARYLDSSAWQKLLTEQLRGLPTNQDTGISDAN